MLKPSIPASTAKIKDITRKNVVKGKTLFQGARCVTSQSSTLDGNVVTVGRRLERSSANFTKIKINTAVIILRKNL